MGDNSSSEQGHSTTSSFPSRIKGNMEKPFNRKRTECPSAISDSTHAKKISFGICFIAILQKWYDKTTKPLLHSADKPNDKKEH